MPAGRKEKPFAAPCRQGGRKNLLEKVLSFPPCTPSILFQNFLCSLFHFALHAKMKKRDIRFENEEVQKGNARICLLSGMLSVCTVTLVDFKRILCKAQGAGKGIRTCTDLYGLVRTRGTGAVRAMCFGISIAQGCVFCWLAKRIAQCRYCGQRMSDLSDLSDLSDDWHRVQ